LTRAATGGGLARAVSTPFPDHGFRWDHDQLARVIHGFQKRVAFTELSLGGGLRAERTGFGFCFKRGFRVLRALQ
jgi:hypothetical protein